jgi:hypothetical protein
MVLAAAARTQMKLSSFIPGLSEKPPLAGPVDEMDSLPPNPIRLPGDLERRLVALRHRRRLIAISETIVALASVLCLLWLAQGVADWFVPLPWLVRVALFLADLAVLRWIYLHYFAADFRAGSSLSHVALLVEKRWPDLRQSLISAVELAAGGAGSTRGSYHLVFQVLDLAHERTMHLDFKEVVPWRPFLRWLLLGVLIAAGAITAMTAAWPASLMLLERVLLSPRPQTVVVPITKDLAVPLGNDVTLSVRTAGRLPDGGRVTVRYAGFASQELPVETTPGHPDVFTLTLANVQKPFTYRFHLNDGESPEFKVDAEVPPAIASLDFAVTYPAYTGLPPEIRTASDLTILAGSRLRVTITATQDLRSATINLIGTPTPQSIEMKPGPDGKKLAGEISIPVKDLTGFSIHLVNASGFPSANETIYSVYPVPDPPPQVKLLKPLPEIETVVLHAMPLIVCEASDNFGLAKLSLKFQRVPPSVRGQPGQPLPVQEIPLPLDQPKTDHVEYTLDISAQEPRWREGWTVDYWIEAVDNNSVTGPGITVSKRNHFGLVTPVEKEAEIARRLKEAATTLDNLSGEEDRLSDPASTVNH